MFYDIGYRHYSDRHRKWMTDDQSVDETRYRQIYSRYRNNAKQRGRDFTLTFAEAVTLFRSDCRYCGMPPLQILEFTHSFIRYNGIDRVDNDQGYVLENCVPCCSTCNYLKADASLETFLAYKNQQGW